MAAADSQRRELNDNVANRESSGAVGNGGPVPLFMDVDGGLCALPGYLGAMWPDLEEVELDLPEPYPTHVWVIPAAVTALNELIDDGFVRQSGARRGTTQPTSSFRRLDCMAAPGLWPHWERDEAG